MNRVDCFRLTLTAVMVALVSACGREEALPQATAGALSVVETRLMVATPTLASGLPTAPPPPPTLDPGVTPPTPTPTATAVPTSTPTATPRPEARLEFGKASLIQGDAQTAISELTASLDGRRELSGQQVDEALYELGNAYLREGMAELAAEAFEELLTTGAGEIRPEVYFHLGRAYGSLAEYSRAINAYDQYLLHNPDMLAYVKPLIAELLLAQGDDGAAIAAYESALEGTAHPDALFDIRYRLAVHYIDAGQYETAATHFDSLGDLAGNDNQKAEMTLRSGEALVLAGDQPGAFERYLAAVMDYPRAYASYLALVELVEAGQPVDDFQRGLVDYYAEMYIPAIEAFSRHIEDNPDTYLPGAHLYTALSLESMGNLQEAMEQLAQYQELRPAEGLMEEARMQARQRDWPAAIDTYLLYLEQFPEGEQAAFAAWWAAALTERMGDLEESVKLYLRLASDYGEHEDAPEALFRAGWLSHLLGDGESAEAYWWRSAQTYPRSEYGSASLFWLLKTARDREPAPDQPKPENVTREPDSGVSPPNDEKAIAIDELQAAIAGLVADHPTEYYFSLRARDLLEGTAPFASPEDFVWSGEDPSDQNEAEAWLRAFLSLESGTVVGELSAELRADQRLVRGEKLWFLEMFEEAKSELESLRRDNSSNILHSYQLALFFRDLGLYRSSILAASSVLRLTEHSVFEAPRFLGRLAYPVYYADLILPLAAQYGYDPRLQFALVRQESLFETFARSGAAAQGLAQVIPDTGAYIAQRMGWPDYENEDLFRPYVGLSFGAYYLQQQLRSFDGHVHVALSAYNAGPGNAARWFEVAGEDLDTYLETIDFAETRLYVERIYVGYVAYRYLYG